MRLDKQDVSRAFAIGRQKHVRNLFEFLAGYTFIIAKMKGRIEGGKRAVRFINDVERQYLINERAFVTQNMLRYAEFIKMRLMQVLKRNGRDMRIPK